MSAYQKQGEIDQILRSYKTYWPPGQKEPRIVPPRNPLASKLSHIRI